MEPQKKLHELSFEEAAERGLHRTHDDESIPRITVNRYPRHLSAGVLSIKDKHRNLTNMSNVQCVATALGASIIQQNEMLNEIERIKKRCAGSPNLDEFIWTFQDRHYDFGPHFKSLYSAKTSIATLPWVEGVISTVTPILGLTRPTVTIMALTMGLSRSDKWLHPSLKDMYLNESKRFLMWIEGLWREMSGSVSVPEGS